jgi:hypothetical protein
LGICEPGPAAIAQSLGLINECRVFEPTFFPFLVTVVSVAAVPAMAAGRAFVRRIGRRHNEAGTCARCAQPWSSQPGEQIEAFVVEGQLVCAACAAPMRARTIGALGVFAILAATMLWFGWGPIIATMARDGVVDALVGLTRYAWLMNGLPPLVVLAAADWSVRTMHQDNVKTIEDLARARLRRGAGTQPSNTRLTPPVPHHT